MWEAAAEKIISEGGKIGLEEHPTKIYRSGLEITIETNKRTISTDIVISSMPLSLLRELLGHVRR